MMSQKRQVFVGFAALFLFLLIPYATGIKNDLVFDDNLLLDDSFRHSYGQWLQVKQRFLSYGSFFWVEALFGEGWWKQRVFNLALHMATAFVLFRFYRLLVGTIRPSLKEGGSSDVSNINALVLAGVAFYALNPVAVYAVAYLIQRSILMATLCVVVALWAFAKALLDGRKIFFGLSLLAYLAALAAKEHALLAPLCVVPLYVFIRRPPLGRLLRLVAAGSALTLVAGGVFALIYGRIVGTAFDEFSKAFLNQLETLSPGIGERAWPLSILNQMHLFIQYGWRWFFPIPEVLSIDLRPPFPLALLSYPHWLGALAYLATFVTGAWMLLRWRDARSLAGLCLLLAIILHGTEFATVWVQDPFVLYRSYLWAIAVPGLLVALLFDTSPRTLLFGGIFIAALLTAGAVERVLSFSSPVSVWSDAIAKLGDDPRSVGRWRPYLNRGEEYVKKGLLEPALKDFNAANQAGGTLQFGQFNRGVVLYMTKKFDAAVEAFNLAEKNGYTDPELYYQRALAYQGLKNKSAAKMDFDRAIQSGIKDQFYWIALEQRGYLAFALGQPAEAIVDLERFFAQKPEAQRARLALGHAHALAGQPERARQLLSESLQQTPTANGYYARAIALQKLGDKPGAQRDIEAAIALEPGNTAFQSLRDHLRALR